MNHGAGIGNLMPANSHQLTATLTTGGQVPPNSVVPPCHRRNSPAMVITVTLSRAMLLKELRDINTILAAAYLWLAGAMDTFTCEDKIVLAQARLESLRKAIAGEDEEYLQELREQVINASRGLY